MTENPYQSPNSDVAVEDRLDEIRMRRLAGDQKLIIYALLLYGAVVALSALVHPGAALLIFVAFILGLVGVVRALIALDSHLVVKVIYLIMMFIPLLNLLALARISSKITASLRKSGHEVGFLGAKI